MKFNVQYEKIDKINAKKLNNRSNRNRSGLSGKPGLFSRVGLITVMIILLLSSVTFASTGMQRGDIVRFFNSADVAEGEIIDGDVVSIIGGANIDGEVRGDVVTIIGNTRISDTALVDGDVVNIIGNVENFGGSNSVINIIGSLALGGNIYGDVVQIIGNTELSSGTLIHGDLVSFLGGLDNQNGQILGQEITVISFLPDFLNRLLPGEYPPLPIILILVIMFSVLTHVFAFIFGAIIVTIFSDQFTSMSESVKVDPGRKLGMGVLLYLVLQMAIVTVAITIIGIPLLLFIIPLSIFIQFAGNLIVKIAIGRKMAKNFDREYGLIGELLIGTLIYMLLDILVAGKPITFVMKFFGMGELAARALDRKGPARVQQPQE